MIWNRLALSCQIIPKRALMAKEVCFGVFVVSSIAVNIIGGLNL